ncbi:hypothetical protein [Nocardia sp. NBC_00416]|uniref:hypothetical protein n=1 Tax=Nocardia sp. NBC_00416 TaxID=2975991 RepID=UPI002E1F411A
MTKVILALHGTGLGARLTAPAFRTALAAAGVGAVQVNLDDADVAPAIMRFGPAEPITALVSVWTDGDPAAVVRTVADSADESTPHAYLVRERVRLDPVPVPDGVRCDAMVNIALLRRPGSMTREEYLRYWLIQHTPIAIRTQNTVAYIQNVVEEVLTPSAPEIAAIVEEHFPMGAMTDPHLFYGSRGDESELDRRVTELMASVARFGAGTGLDLVPTSRYHWNI